ncbi:MAG: dethiobiotin synthase [Lachnospiraceae bacterium]|nr:dethiobiotin synthase [Lachnospiraceae bacterium]
MSKNIFVTGTGTDVGKTYVTGLIVKKLNEMGLNPAYYKAAMSGNEKDKDGKLIPGDAVSVKNMSGISQSCESMCPYVYETAVSPHLASRLEGGAVDIDVVKKGFEMLSNSYDYVTMEGSGGILCPIRKDDKTIFLEDIIKTLNLSTIIVADAGLGTINSVVLTYEYMKTRNINAKGIIFNNYILGDVMQEDNIRMCEELTGLKTLALVSLNDKELKCDGELLKSIYE